MSFSERTYQALLVAYPQDHRRAYGESMVQLFRDRMHRDGGGFGTAVVWSQMGLDLASSATKERMEAIMEVKTWTKQWWEISVVLLAMNSILFGFLFQNSGNLGWGIGIGFVPGILLLAGLGMKNRQRMGATILLTVGSLTAAVAWWVIYTVVLALVVVGGGFGSGKIGFQGSGPEMVA